MGVLWSISPIFTGFWLGRRLSHNAGDLLAMVIGVLVLLLLIYAFEWLPVAGGFATWLLLLFSFAYAVGAMILALVSKDAPPPAPITTTRPPL